MRFFKVYNTVLDKRERERERERRKKGEEKMKNQKIEICLETWAEKTG